MKPLALLALAIPLFAQPRIANSYTATCVLTLSASTKACTIQQPASGSKTVQLVSVYVYSSAAITVAQERDGTAATATAGTAGAVNPTTQAAATAKIWTDSDVGSGTVIPGTIAIPASSAIMLDLEDVQLNGDGTAKNYTVRTSTGTATVTIILKWREY